MFSDTNMPSNKVILSTAVSIATTAMLVRSIANDILPDEFRDYFFSGIRNLFNRFSSELTMVIEQSDGLANNQIYTAAEIYLGTRTKISPSTQRFRVSKPEKERNFTLTMEKNEEIVDVFEGVQFKWRFICNQIERSVLHNRQNLNETLRSEVRSFELSFKKKHKEKVLESYLPYILKESKEVKEENKTLKIFTWEKDWRLEWGSINLDHPATFATLAIESKLKKEILEDLERFVQRKEYYRRVGKAWKRGYLLYGPPGTGKSSLIAAMANYLKFDIYDLELTSIHDNMEFRKMLVDSANRSILVVEDIDCTIDLQGKAGEARSNNGQTQSEVTLSGLLNFIDGLWSSCGDERIIVFTTNHKERLDPALLRPGRMDMHIHLSYCTPCGLKILASNYLGIHDHPLFEKIEKLVEKVEVTPAEVAEQLMRGDESEIVLQNLIEFLRKKKIEQEEAKALEEKTGGECQEGQQEQEIQNNGQKEDKKEFEGQKVEGVQSEK